MENDIIIFENEELKLEVNMKDEMVWLSTEQMAKLFERDYKTIRKHINNALIEELDSSTVAKIATLQTEGQRKVIRNIDCYNLDMVISVGYRVKSRNGIIFRRWANKVLKDYLIKGYTVNNKRLEYLEKTVKLINIASRIDDNLNGNDAKEIIKVINSYSKALNILNDYDYKRIVTQKGTRNNNKITYDDCIKVIEKLKFNIDSNLFAIERNKGLESIIETVYSSFDGEDLYPSIEEKAANFLYLITKNHTFIDGNKRIAATLFIYFLNYYNLLYKEGREVIDNNTLVAITILIASSDPKEKDILVSLVTSFICQC